MATILIVDDLSANRSVLVTLLRHQGHRLLEAADGCEGLAAAHVEHPDLVITDVLMPGMDGYELVRQLRLDPTTSGIPVVFYTAHYGQREARDLALSSGVADVLTKPAEPEEVLRIVGGVLTGTSAAGTQAAGSPLTTEFDREHLRLLTDKLSEKAGDLRTANSRLRALINIGLELASERDADRLLQSVCVAARDLFAATYVTLGILDLNSQTVQRFVTRGVDAANWIKIGDPLPGILRTVIAERRPMRGDNAGGDPVRLQLPVLHPEVQAFLAAPIVSPAHVYGWICLIGNEGQTFTDDDEQLLMALTGQVGRIYESSDFSTITLKRAEELEREVLERQQAEAALRHERDRSQQYLDTVQVILVALDVDGRIALVNRFGCAMLGWTAEELLGRESLTFLPARLGDAPEQRFSDSVAGGLSISENVVRTKSGEERLIEWRHTVLRDTAGRVTGTLSSGTDNTARQQAEVERMKLDQRLRDQNFYTRSLIESSIDALMTTDPGGIITDVNKQAEALTGFTRDELIGASFKSCFTDPDRAEAGINRVLNEGTVTNYELTARAIDGTLTVVSYNATTFHDRDGKLQGVFAAARDVTELKRFEQTLQQKNVELEHAGRMKAEFLATMSHELRTPLNAIIGFSEVLRDGLIGELTERQRAFTTDIFSSGQHLLSLINDILDLSKVEAGKMALDLEEVQVSSLLANSLSIVTDRAALRHIRLEMNGVEGLSAMQVDARKVKQIVYNLLANAVKFTHDGGQVTLSATPVRRADVGTLSGPWAGRTLGLANEEFAEFLQVSVTDTGIGIPPEALERLFTPFNQIDSGLARKFEGTGLGLAMVKLLAELHGGMVAVQSAVGEGSCFTVWLPLRASRNATLKSTKAPAPVVKTLAGARTALVVEDDFKSAELIRVQLEAEGFTVLHAATAEVALQLAVQQSLTLITLDLMLPDMDGWEFFSRLKQVPELCRIPVVIISGVADPQKGFSLGAAAVLQKPFSRQQLSESFVDLGLIPYSPSEKLTVLVIDDDPKSLEMIAVHIQSLTNTVLLANSGREGIEVARREMPDVIVLDLMMPDVNGFDVVAALGESHDTARIPILVVTAKEVTAEDRAKLHGSVSRIMQKDGFDATRFVAEVRRAVARV